MNITRTRVRGRGQQPEPQSREAPARQPRDLFPAAAIPSAGNSRRQGSPITFSVSAFVLYRLGCPQVSRNPLRFHFKRTQVDSYAFSFRKPGSLLFISNP